MFLFPVGRKIRHMKYMDVKSASEKWGITPRRVRILCNDGRIDGAVRNGWSWVIPTDTPKPRDGRVLRRFKALDIRPGTVDVDGLRELRHLVSLPDFLSSPGFDNCMAHTLSFLFALNGEEVTVDEIMRILSGFLVYNLSLKTHLMVVNFVSILKEEAKREAKWGEGDLRRMYSSLLRGVKDTDGSYRKGKVVRGEEKVEVADAVETVFTQYDQSWSGMHPLTSALLLSGELMRIKPYEDYTVFFHYLVFASELMRKGYIPPMLTASTVNEVKAAYALVSSKGVYIDMTAYMERMMKVTYEEIKKDV